MPPNTTSSEAAALTDRGPNSPSNDGDARAPAVTETRWLLVAIGFIAGCAASFNIGKISAALPVLGAELELNPLSLSWLVSIFSLVSAILGLFIGFLGGMFGAQRALMLALSSCAVGSIAGAFASGFPFLLATRVVEGAGWLLIAVSVPVLLTAVTHPRHKSVVLGMWGAFVPVGMMIALIVSPLILSQSGWKLLWLSGGVFSAFWAIVCWRSFSGISLPKPPPISVALVSESIGHRLPWLLAGCFFAYSAQFVVVTAFLPSLLLDRHDLVLTSAAWFGSLVVISNAVGNVLSGFLLRAGIHYSRLLMTASFLMGLSAIGLYSGIFGLLPTVALGSSACLIGGLIPGTLFVSIPGLAKKSIHIAFMLGLVMQLAGLGQLLGSLALGRILLISANWSHILWLCMALMVMGILCTVPLSGKKNCPGGLTRKPNS